MTDFSRFFMVRDAVASVSLSHAEDCGCLTCRAARGDEAALVQIIEALDQDDHPRATD